MFRTRSPFAAKEMPFDAWPEHHRRAFEHSVANPNDGSDGFEGARILRPKTIKAMRQAIARFLGHLRDTDSTKLNLSFVDSLDFRSLQHFCQSLSATNNSVSVASNVARIYSAVRRMEPTVDWEWLRVMLRRLEAVAMPRKRTAILLTSTGLTDIGLKLMDDAETAWCQSEKGRPRRFETALHYRDGLMLCLTALLPMRASNILDLKIGDSCALKGDHWSLFLDSAQTKNKDPIEVDLPIWISTKLSRFVDQYRPAFSSAGTNWLFVSRQADRLSISGLERAFQRSVFKVSGASISPHDARRIAATTIAVADPVNVASASDLLGHRSKRVTERHYNLASAIKASQAMSDVLGKLRKRRPGSDPGAL